MATLGQSLNNPGNIRQTRQVWKGQLKCASRFVKFVDRTYGYRAMFCILRTYISLGVDTVEKIISRWAPSCENDTEAYIKFVTKHSGIVRDVRVDFGDKQQMCRLVAAMALIESGIKEDEACIEQGYEMAKTL